MKSTDELKSEIYIHTQGIIDDDVCVECEEKRRENDRRHNHFAGA